MEQHGYMAPITGETFLCKWRSGGLRITCKESTPTEDEAGTITESHIRHLTQHKVMFSVDTRNTDKNRMILHFILKQSTTKDILVPMHLKGITDFTLSDIPLEELSAGAGEISTSQARPTEESRGKDFDDLLRTVAKQIHKDIDINSIGKELGFASAEITRYIKRNKKYGTVTYMGTLAMLRDWRIWNTIFKESQHLKKALISINHRQLADDLLNYYMEKITETSPGKKRSVSLRPSASTSAAFSFQDASASAGEVTSYKARVLIHDEQHEDERTQLLSERQGESPIDALQDTANSIRATGYTFMGQKTIKKPSVIPEEEQSTLLAASPLESENIKRTAKKTIGPDGGEIELDHYGVHMTIPAGALDDDQEIIMKLLGIPPEPAIQEGEMLASFGVQLNPCGLKFKKPVQIRMPHCAKLASTSPIKMVLYHSRDGTLTTVDMVSQDLRNTPAVVVQERDFVLHIGEFCDICAVFKDGFLGKDVRCVISSRPCSGSNNHDLKITLADDIPNENSITDGYKQICGHQCTRFYVQLHIADVSIALFDNISEKCTESLTEKQIFRRTQNDTYFPEIDTDSFTKLQVRLFHGERANITCSKPGELVREQPTPEPHCANISAQKLNDDQLMKVSKKISHGKYNELSVQLGCSLISANKILVKHGQDYEKALLEVLMKWNQQTTCDHMNQLIKALEKAGVAGQISEIFPD